MTRKWGDTGLAMMGSRHVLNITYPAPDETLLETPEALPTSEPETPQVSFTIGAAHLPNIQGASAVWTALVNVAGRNTSGTLRTVTRVRYLNGTETSRQTTGNITNNYYWSETGFTFYDFKVGDTVAEALYASGEGVDWRYRSLFVYPTRLTLPHTAIYRVQYALDDLPALTLGTPALEGSRGAWNVYNGDMVDASTTTTTAQKAYSCLPYDPTYGFGQTQFGDESLSGYALLSGTYYPRYYRQTLPTQIVYYPLAVR